VTPISYLPILLSINQTPNIVPAKNDIKRRIINAGIVKVIIRKNYFATILVRINIEPKPVPTKKVTKTKTMTAGRVNETMKLVYYTIL
jgi:hypothetical protein